MKKKPSKKLLLIPFLLLWVFSCGEDTIVNPPAYTYRIPEQTDDGWQTASLEEVGISEEIVSEVINRVNYHLYQNVHALVIVKDGKLVLEEYFPGYTFDYAAPDIRGEYTDYDRNTIHYLASVTKSFTSALVGIAIDRGLIQGVDDKVFSFFPEYSDLNDEEKDRITLAHFLSMTAGLQWDEWSFPYTDARNDHVGMNNSGSQIGYVLGKPVVAEPGTKFVYNSGLSITLGGIIHQASGLRADTFAERYLFSPLGISDYYWSRYPNGTVQAGGGLSMRPRDMAKFGYLYLNNGVWNGEQIISKRFIEESTKERIPINSQWRYGYQWWLRTYQSNSEQIESFAANGWGGQRITVFPSLNMVVVFTGGNYVTPEPVDEILTRFILPAVL